ncbi:MAG: transglycosylase domain-containing protein [Patescibacteria group bacterium]
MSTQHSSNKKTKQQIRAILKGKQKAISSAPITQETVVSKITPVEQPKKISNSLRELPAEVSKKTDRLGFIKKFLGVGGSAKQKKTAQQPTTPPPKKKRRLPLLFRIILFPILNPLARFFTIFLFLVIFIGVIYTLRDLPSPRRMTASENYPVSTQLFDRNGVLLYEIFGNEHRVPIKIDTLPKHVTQATIAIEDKNFYHHFGFDIQGIVRAFSKNIQGGRLEGGSTITQQLVKNALLTSEKSFKRKIKEVILAMFTEIIYSKEEILEMYLNYIPYGGTAVGIEAASQQYFEKPASQLTLPEAALLAGLPQAPSYYSPFGSNAVHSKERQAEVLRRMVEDGYITQLEAEKAKSDTLHFALSKTDIQAPHFVFYVRDLLYEKYGEDTVKKAGLRVTTTLDLNLQESAQASLSAEIANLKRLRVTNGAAIVSKPNTGEILAMIGSKDYFDATAEGQVNVTIANRQPGSSIKPLVYATAFQNKTLNPGTVLLDVPTCFKIPNQKAYCPKNYNGGFSGPVTVRHSLGNSLNIPAVKAIYTIGVTKFIDQATKMGITTWSDPSNYGPAIALGGGEVRMVDLAQAFSTLANQGVKVPLTPFLKIEDYKGKVLFDLEIDKRKADLEEIMLYANYNKRGDLERVMDRAPAYLVSHIMQDNNARTQSFGSRSELVIPNQIVSVKTGTTNDLKDNWTIGFTPEYLVAVWVGNNDNTPMSNVASGVTGAAPIWNDIMSLVLQGKEPIWQEKPDDVVASGVCASGFPPDKSDPSCSVRYTELFWKKSLPSKSTYKKVQVWIRPETGLPPKEGEPTDGLVLQEKMILEDPVTSSYCSDCTRAVDEQGRVVYEQHVVESYNQNSGSTTRN